MEKFCFCSVSAKSWNTKRWRRLFLLDDEMISTRKDIKLADAYGLPAGEYLGTFLSPPCGHVSVVLGRNSRLCSDVQFVIFYLNVPATRLVRRVRE